MQLYGLLQNFIHSLCILLEKQRIGPLRRTFFNTFLLLLIIHIIFLVF